MMTSRMVLAGLLVGAIGGCTSTTIDGPISYLPGGGFTGTGDGTSPLRVEVDGTLVRTQLDGSSETAKLDAARLDALHNKILDAGFPTLEPMYQSNTADDYFYDVSVQLDGTSYRVSADSMAPPPARLQAVIDALGEASQLPLDWH